MFKGIGLQNLLFSFKIYVHFLIGKKNPKKKIINSIHGILNLIILYQVFELSLTGEIDIRFKQFCF